MGGALDFSQTQRIVFLIDLHPLLHLQNPKHYITSVIDSARTFLTFPPLSSSLFAFKLFFSSLSPLLSSSKLHRLLGKSAVSSFSFDRPSQTLLSLSETLNSLPALSGTLISPPRASLTSSSLLQLIHDYAWEPRIQDLIGKSTELPTVRSNLILLFSPASRSLKCLSEFVDVKIDDESLVTVDVFSEKFFQLFGSVSEGFVDRDIHFSWIDVIHEQDYGGESVEREELVLGKMFLGKGIKRLGWGFCSTDAIIVGSALIPFGLIYPNIVCPSIGYNLTNCPKIAHAELNLEILDVNEKPLECKGCDLELFDFKLPCLQRSDDVLHALEPANSVAGRCHRGKTFWGDIGDGILNIRVKEVQRRNDESIKIDHQFNDSILVHALSEEHGKGQKKESSDDLFADKVLEMLWMETDGFMSVKSIPIWQLLLNFLSRGGYWALVSVAKDGGDSFMGILKPLTIHTAILSIVNSGYSFCDSVHHSNQSSFSLLGSAARTESDVSNDIANLNHSNGPTASQPGALSYKISSATDDAKRKRNRKHLKSLQDFTWSSFYQAVLNHFEVDLEEVYFARKLDTSKKLRFLRCWMKQVKKSSCCQIERNVLKTDSHIQKEMEGKFVGSQQEECDQPVLSSHSNGETLLSGDSGVREDVDPIYSLENLESFFGSIPQKIQHGLESADVDLGALAERLVESCIRWLYWKHELENKNLTHEEHMDGTCAGTVAAELIKLLLKEPKDLTAKYKGHNPSSDPSSALYTSENIIREYELQILFRMEILRSKVKVGVEETIKQKMVKQICSLLDIIQYHLAGGFFGDVSLGMYAGRTIKNRYSDSLGDVVQRIYTRMDLLLFDDEDDEAPGSLFNSEDSDQSRRITLEKNEVNANSRVCSESTSSRDEHLHPPENQNKRLVAVREEEHVHQRLMEAQERRERARRFSSFTSWVPDLQRVWAPRQPKAMVKAEYLRKLSKRKKEQRGDSYDVVCETPMTGKKLSCTRGSTGDVVNSSGSVSKALFQDEGS
ncbi:PREDICTED: uncharacterized protein LOC104600290 [Nelumbo nucifera]|uniref:Uncharacterized protein LOC104600290 n=2 Tax=Nelumbo nucifera TaxID=4432 RepID=A0A1U8AGE1_NELNU|nr:PREDICTED: uncharacterized protein LOC104600290 [Nelumbo nucifera]DAD19118.1 TPA_asm: hypothetical protein HUJ06_020581 [Nelumbo nucifera]